MPPQKTPDRPCPIDAVRAVAALIVVVVHARPAVKGTKGYAVAGFFNFLDDILFPRGQLGVAVFFVISNYVNDNSNTGSFGRVKPVATIKPARNWPADANKKNERENRQYHLPHARAQRKFAHASSSTMEKEEGAVGCDLLFEIGAINNETDYKRRGRRNQTDSSSALRIFRQRSGRAHSCIHASKDTIGAETCKRGLCGGLLTAAASEIQTGETV